MDEAATGHVVPLDNPVVTPLPQWSMDVTLVGIGIVDVKIGILRYAAILASQCVLQHLCVHGGLFERME